MHTERTPGEHGAEQECRRLGDVSISQETPKIANKDQEARSKAQNIFFLRAL